MFDSELPIIPRLAYRAEDFILHSGIKSTYQKILELSCNIGFSFVNVYGDIRSGKTHCSIKLFEDLVASGKFPILVEKLEELPTFLPGTIFIIDGLSLSSNQAAFINLVESCHSDKDNASKVVIFSYKDQSGLDQHITSRLKLAEHFYISPPQHEEMPVLCQQMARQRGFAINDSTAEAVAKFTGRSLVRAENLLSKASAEALRVSKPVSAKLIRDIAASM